MAEPLAKKRKNDSKSKSKVKKEENAETEPKREVCITPCVHLKP